MLRFKVYEKGAPARGMSLDGAHLLGTDRVPVRGEIKYAGGNLVCEARSRGAAALAIMWSVPGAGRILLETPRLLERQEPYNLHVELARGQLMRISQKREDWGLFDVPEGQPLYDEIDQARDLLVAAMTAADDASASKLAEQSLTLGVKIGEKLGAFHADAFLAGRRSDADAPRQSFGCRVHPASLNEQSAARLAEAFDFAQLPFTWNTLQTKDGKYETAHLEKALQLLHGQKTPIWGCSLLSFESGELPGWLGKIGKDFDRLREVIARHQRTILKSFEGHVQTWEVSTGLHAHNTFHLSFEQLLELTRMSTLIARQAAPKCQVIVGMVLPWGEYYAEDPQTIPPPLYADMLFQSGVNFDGLGIHLQFGGQHTAQFVRDMMQVSSILDRFGNYGKPLHVTCAGVPSAGLTPMSGYWHDEWSEQVQADWLREFYRAALSKPFVESVTWQILADGSPPSPWGGLLKKNLTPKASFEQVLSLHKEFSVAS